MKHLKTYISFNEKVRNIFGFEVSDELVSTLNPKFVIKITGIYPNDKLLTYYNYLDKSNNEIHFDEFNKKISSGKWVSKRY